MNSLDTHFSKTSNAGKCAISCTFVLGIVVLIRHGLDRLNKLSLHLHRALLSGLTVSEGIGVNRRPQICPDQSG